MKVLVLGQGGREHALCRALRLSQSVKTVFTMPGSDGIGFDAQRHNLVVTPERVVQFCQTHQIDLVVVGPEQFLLDGVTDALRKQNVPVFGPSQAAAQLEASKIYCKEFLKQAGIPTAHSVVVTRVQDVDQHVAQFTPPYVLKADGLAAGKGVVICPTKAELLEAAEAFFVRKIHGAAGSRALLEQFTPGYELSYHILTDGKGQWSALPLAYDHKKLLDGERGPNTGGMGTVAPISIDSSLESTIEKLVILPTVNRLAAISENDPQFLYRGVLYIGLMITPDGPSVLEFNTRFGDPECQVMMPLLEPVNGQSVGDWGALMLSVAKGQIAKARWRKDRAAACVVLASEGYPDQPIKGAEILGLPIVESEDQYLLHAGTLQQDHKWLTNGGRVLNCVGLGNDIKSALENAYGCAKKIHWNCIQFRRDIGQRAL